MSLPNLLSEGMLPGDKGVTRAVNKSRLPFGLSAVGFSAKVEALA
jgi:hypothetical protein